MKLLDLFEDYSKPNHNGEAEISTKTTVDMKNEIRLKNENCMNFYGRVLEFILVQVHK